MTSAAIISCKVCAEESLEEIAEYGTLPRVTSDCKPWPAGGRLGICMSCGAVQKFADQRWFEEAGAIYRDYEIYHQSAGVEQEVFDPASGASTKRSRRLAEFLDKKFDLPAGGSVLDVGCGSGATLSAFSEVKPQWALYGYDLDQRRLEILQRLTYFRQLFTGEIPQIPGEYSIVTLVHATEHLPQPLATLRELGPRLGRNGRLMIQVPDYSVNPFDLPVADHLLHFSLDTLVRLLEAADYAVEFASDSVIVKELTLVARHQHGIQGDVNAVPRITPSAHKELVSAALAWLANVIDQARKLAARGTLGVFGTSVAGAWIGGAMGDSIAFFVDEDPSRIGRSFMGRPVYAVSAIPAGAQVYIPLAPVVARSIEHRHRGRAVQFHLPPEL